MNKIYILFLLTISIAGLCAISSVGIDIIFTSFRIDENPAENYSAILFIVMTFILFLYFTMDLSGANASSLGINLVKAVKYFTPTFVLVVICDLIHGDGVAIMLFVLVTGPGSLLLPKIGSSSSIRTFLYSLLLWIMITLMISVMDPLYLLIFSIVFPLFVILIYLWSIYDQYKSAPNIKHK